MPQLHRRTGRGYHPRRNRTREIRQRFLIVCEGQKTEPEYFRAYASFARVIGAPGDPIGVVNKAMEVRDQSRIELNIRKPYDQIWCVFDRDDVPTQRFNEAITSANREGFGVAYSNEAFELWYLLHFHYFSTGISRAGYSARLDALLGHHYQKNSRSMFRELLSKQPDAIRNAQRLLAQYSPCWPAEDNPSTTVHLLVEELNRFVR
ncbi:MAG: RloB family protein [Chloroflexi bacterium]|nr:RloB family protein [Chloroflexota bacterium]